MILVFGGTFQGKLNFVKENYKVENIIDLSYDSNIDKKFYKKICDDFSKKQYDIFLKNNNNNAQNSENAKTVIYDLHHLVRYVIENSLSMKELYDAIDYFEKNNNIIIVSDDVSNCLVPIDKIDRIYREELSKLLCYISKKSVEVFRVFVGIAEKIK